MHECLAQEASVLIAYHPPLFKPTRALTLASPIHASLLRLAAEGVSVYSPHTALDAVWGGVNASGGGCCFAGKTKGQGA